MHTSEGLRRLKEIVKAGTTQKEIAETIGRTKGAVCNLVAGRWPPDLKTAVGLQSHYGIPIPSWLQDPRQPKKRNGKTG